MYEEVSVPVSAGNTATAEFGVLTAVSLRIWVVRYVALCCAVCVVRTVARALWPLKTSESTHLMTKESCPIRVESSDHCLKVFKNTHVQGRTLTNKVSIVMILGEEQKSEMCLLLFSLPYLKQFISWHLTVNRHCCVYSKLKMQVFLSQNTTLLFNKSATCAGCYHYPTSSWSQ